MFTGSKDRACGRERVEKIMGRNGYRNSKRMAINGMVKRLCKEEDVGYVDLWDSFVGKEEMYVRDGLHLNGKGLPFLPRDCQGRLPVAWVKYDI